jgi:hypothetical protein
MTAILIVALFALAAWGAHTTYIYNWRLKYPRAPRTTAKERLGNWLQGRACCGQITEDYK